MKFKSIVMTMFILIFVSKVLYAQNEQEFFLQANNHFEQKDYEKALASYKSITKKGKAVWFNMGICYDQIEDFARAYLCFKRAQKQASITEVKEIKKVLDTLSAKYNKSYEQDWYFSSWLLDWIELHFSFLDLQLLFLLCWYLLLFYSRRIYSRVITRFLCIPICLCVLSFAVGIIVKYNDMQYPTGIVMHETSLLAGPNKDYHILDSLMLTDQLSILKQKPDWYKVRYGSHAGWVESKDVEIV